MRQPTWWLGARWTSFAEAPVAIADTRVAEALKVDKANKRGAREQMGSAWPRTRRGWSAECSRAG